jgi:hypothetical protein
MSSPEQFACPLCKAEPLQPRGALRFACPMHGMFIMIGDALTLPGRVVVGLEHVSTSLRFELDTCSPDIWQRRAREGR